MMRRQFKLAGCLLLGTLLTSVAATAQTSKPVYPESEAGLRQFFREILDASAARDQAKLLALCEALILPDPDAWFTKTFGEKIGKKLATDYKNEHKNFAMSLARLFFSLKEPRELEIQITVVQSFDDTKVKGYQQLAIAAMVEPTPLYTVSITKAGTNAHITLWSVVYTNDRFHLAGKMRGIKDVDDKTAGQ